jgi:hypothetical protein
VRVLRVDGFSAKMSFGTRIPLCLKDRGAVKPLILPPANANREAARFTIDWLFHPQQLRRSWCLYRCLPLMSSEFVIVSIMETSRNQPPGVSGANNRRQTTSYFSAIGVIILVAISWMNHASLNNFIDTDIPDLDHNSEPVHDKFDVSTAKQIQTLEKRISTLEASLERLMSEHNKLQQEHANKTLAHDVAQKVVSVSSGTRKTQRPTVKDETNVNPDSSSNIKSDFASGEKIFLDVARDFQPTTDKVTHHPYEIMYGMFLLPFYSYKPNMKFLEIGLGCDMTYGPGASVALWRKLFPKAELWEAEFDATCANKMKNEGKLDGFNLVTGDQMNMTVLDGWIKQSGGGHFDVVIDDGGHRQCEIWNTFVKFWPLLQPGGLYFIEDLQVSRMFPYMGKRGGFGCPKDFNVVDKLKEIQDAMLHRKAHTIGYADVKFVFCQRDACVLGKADETLEPKRDSTYWEIFS